jgi:hypothetical protein
MDTPLKEMPDRPTDPAPGAIRLRGDEEALSAGTNVRWAYASPHRLGLCRNQRKLGGGRADYGCNAISSPINELAFNLRRRGPNSPEIGIGRSLNAACAAERNRKPA